MNPLLQQIIQLIARGGMQQYRPPVAMTNAPSFASRINPLEMARRMGQSGAALSQGNYPAANALYTISDTPTRYVPPNMSLRGAQDVDISSLLQQIMPQGAPPPNDPRYNIPTMPPQPNAPSFDEEDRQ